MEPRRKPQLSQEQLDRIVRCAAGKHAIESLVLETPAFQRYELDNGALLTVRKRTGAVSVKGGSRESAR